LPCGSAKAHLNHPPVDLARPAFLHSDDATAYQCRTASRCLIVTEALCRPAGERSRWTATAAKVSDWLEQSSTNCPRHAFIWVPNRDYFFRQELATYIRRGGRPGPPPKITVVTRDGYFARKN